MKVTVNKFLNARSGYPKTSAPIPFFRPPGTTLDIDDVLAGTEIDGNALWYHCTDDGCYYWSGGIEETAFELDKDWSAPDSEDLKAILYNNLKRHFAVFYKFRYPYLTGLRIGDKKQNNITIAGSYLIFQVSAKRKEVDLEVGERLPAAVVFKGIRILTDVVEMPKAALDMVCTGWEYPGVSSPRKIGGSVSALRESDAGTISFVAESASMPGTWYIVTNYHVVAMELLKQNIRSYENPSAGIKVVSPAWFYMEDEKNIKGSMVMGRFSQFHDVAFVRLDKHTGFVNRFKDDTQITGFLDVFRKPFYKNKEVKMYGARSGVRTGRIINVDVNMDFTGPGNISNAMVELLELEKMSCPGDSGSPVLYEGQIIGIIVGSNDQYSYAIPIDKIINYGNLKRTKQ